jgi:hypothetical protein
MFRLLLFHVSSCTLHLMHCTIMLLAHIWLVYLLGHVYAEATEQAQAEEFTNLVWIKVSPGASHQIFLDFSFNLYNCVMLVCPLGL